MATPRLCRSVMAQRVLRWAILRPGATLCQRANVGARGVAWLQRQTLLDLRHQCFGCVAGCSSHDQTVIAEDQHIRWPLRETRAHRLRKWQAGMMVVKPVAR